MTLGSTQLTEIRQEIMSAAPGAPIWDSAEYRAYSDRASAFWAEDEYQMPLFFVRDETECLFGFYHHHSCPEADPVAPLVRYRQAMEDMLSEHGPDLETLAECSTCYGADLLIRVYEVVAKPAAEKAASQARRAAEREAEKARHDLARTVACPACGSPAGRNCRTSSGKSTSKDHAARVQTSQAAK